MKACKAKWYNFSVNIDLSYNTLPFRPQFRVITYVYWGGGWPWATHGSITFEPTFATTLEVLSLIRGGTDPCGSENKENRLLVNNTNKAESFQDKKYISHFSNRICFDKWRNLN